MSYVTAAAFNFRNAAMQINSQQALMNNWQTQQSRLDEVGQLALNNPEALNSPEYMAKLAAQDKALSLQGIQAQIQFQVAQTMREQSNNLLKKAFEDEKKNQLGS
ncbi:MAG: hypothetical protein NTW61_06130 [Candidatus Melainabacteria bacterium]|nr:hypothetical protein [Candidatus Melainabacteria bacterium]